MEKDESSEKTTEATEEAKPEVPKKSAEKVKKDNKV
jgi:hypothetical protein